MDNLDELEENTKKIEEFPKKMKELKDESDKLIKWRDLQLEKKSMVITKLKEWYKNETKFKELEFNKFKDKVKEKHE